MNNITGKKILLVEDQALIAMAEANTMKQCGYEVEIAVSGEEAIQMAASDPSLSLILMDMDLGPDKLSGPEAAERILKQRNIPIVFLTSHSEMEVVESVSSITRYGYVVKNSGEFVLLSSIKMAFELFEAHRQTREREEYLSVTLESIGDALFATDLKGCITRMNKVAEQLTGWSFSEARDKPLHEVFRIYNAKTRQAVVSPVALVLENGKIVGLANDTVLIAKDGTEHQIADSAAPIRDTEGKILGVILTFSDVTAKYLAQKELKESEAHYRALFENMLDGFAYCKMLFDEQQQPVDFVYLEVNSAFGELTGMENVVGKKVTDIIPAIKTAHPELFEIYGRVALTGLPERFEIDFEPMNINLSVSVYSPKKGYFVVVFENITERKAAERQIKQLLYEKDLMLHEVNHRIKNNMGMITSMLALQAHATKDTSIKAALDDAHNRVFSMMILYDRLYKSTDFRNISAKEYLKELISEIEAALICATNIKIESYIEDCLLDTKTLFPVGIIINELITNACKYAFPKGREGVISVSFISGYGNIIEVIMKDNGVGIPEAIDLGTTLSFGLNLVSLLVKQIGGNIELTRDDGTVFRVMFPKTYAVTPLSHCLEKAA